MEDSDSDVDEAYVAEHDADRATSEIGQGSRSNRVNRSGARRVSGDGTCKRKSTAAAPPLPAASAKDLSALGPPTPTKKARTNKFKASTDGLATKCALCGLEATTSVPLYPKSGNLTAAAIRTLTVSASNWAEACPICNKVNAVLIDAANAIAGISRTGVFHDDEAASIDNENYRVHNKKARGHLLLRF
jgi:hypothetical protein